MTKLNNKTKKKLRNNLIILKRVINKLNKKELIICLNELIELELIELKTINL